MMLPVPTVPEIAAENASNCETELVRVSCLRFLPSPFSVGTMVVFSDSLKWVTCRNFVRTESSSPVERMSMITGQPQTTPFIASFIISIALIRLSNI